MTVDDIEGFQSQLQALDLCTALSTGNQPLTDVRSTEGLIRALASYAICLARTVADRDGVTEAEVWGMLIEKFKTTVIATAEIHRMTKAPNSKEGNSNDV